MVGPFYSQFFLRLNETPAWGMRDSYLFLLCLLPRHQPSLSLDILQSPGADSSVETEDCAVVWAQMVHHSLRLMGVLFTKAPALTGPLRALHSLQLPFTTPPPCPVLRARVCAESGPATGFFPSRISARASWMPTSHPLSSIPGLFLPPHTHTQLLNKTPLRPARLLEPLPTLSTPVLHKLQGPWQVFPKL